MKKLEDKFNTLTELIEGKIEELKSIIKEVYGYVKRT